MLYLFVVFLVVYQQIFIARCSTIFASELPAFKPPTLYVRFLHNSPTMNILDPLFLLHVGFIIFASDLPEIDCLNIIEH